jgi:hypothetical protein
MPTFVHPALLWGLLLAGVPVLIHLINMMRHRRVQWAAMEFLLASQKKNRTWILLKQLLLLLARVTVVAVLVLVVAQPMLRGQWGTIFGGIKTHHLVLLDDSYSMSDRWADTSAFAEAKAVVQRIGVEAARQVQPQRFTLLRFSQAGRVALGTQPDLLSESVSHDFPDRLQRILDRLKVSQTAAGAHAALEAIGQLVGDGDGEHRIVYLISDFRAREWNDPRDIRNHLLRMNDTGAELHLVNCVDATHPNLAITNLAPGPGTQAAGVPLFMEVTVENFGNAPLKEVPVLLAADDQARPALTIPEIPPRKAVKERFSVHFPTAGQHVIAARLESDVVAADNFRWCALDFPASLPVLLIDGDPEAIDARYLSAALSPGGPVATGITPRIEKPRYLSLNPLDPFHAIYLLNVERLDQSAIDALEKYAAAGGGVGVFLGPQSQAKFVDDALYRGGKGFFPVPLSSQAELLVDRLQKTPDLDVTEHPIFAVLAGKRNSFLSTVLVNRYFAVPKDWRAEADAKVQVIARLRTGEPLAVERQFGDGRVVAFLTTAAPTWNTWARNNPSFVVAMLEMQAYLSRRSAEAPHPVGAPLTLKLDPTKYDPPVRFSFPETDGPPVSTSAARGANGTLTATLTAPDVSGVYQARLSRKDGVEEVRRVAINVEPEEGDLKTIEGSRLASRLEGVAYKFEQAAMFQYSTDEVAGTNLSESLFYLLLLLLIGEQILAWSASYHPSSKQRAKWAGGGA